MPGSLRFFRQDPNNKGRGRGVYYHRGKGIFSKYEVGPNNRDSKIKAKGWRIDKVGLPRASSKLHAGDGRMPWRSRIK